MSAIFAVAGKLVTLFIYVLVGYVVSKRKMIPPLLSDSRFFLCSKGVIVNLQHVSELEKDHFVLNNGEEVPISRRNLSQAKKTFLDFSLNQ